MSDESCKQIDNPNPDESKAERKPKPQTNIGDLERRIEALESNVWQQHQNDLVKQHQLQYDALYQAKMDMEAELNAEIKALKDSNIVAERALKEAIEAKYSMKKDFYDSTIEFARQIQELNAQNSTITEFFSTIKELELNTAKLSAVLKCTKAKLNEKDRIYDKLKEAHNAMKEEIKAVIESHKEEIEKLKQESKDKETNIVQRDALIAQNFAKIEIYREQISSLKDN